MRAHIFNAGFWVLSALAVLLFSPVLLLSGRGGVAFAIHWHARAFRLWLKVCGVSVEYRGLHHVPAIPAPVFAAKHQSWGDGLLQVARDSELAYVIGDHMLALPWRAGICRKPGRWWWTPAPAGAVRRARLKPAWSDWPARGAPR